MRPRDIPWLAVAVAFWLLGTVVIVVTEGPRALFDRGDDEEDA